jgi:hypothetical protein
MLGVKSEGMTPNTEVKSTKVQKLEYEGLGTREFRNKCTYCPPGVIPRGFIYRVVKGVGKHCPNDP